MIINSYLTYFSALLYVLPCGPPIGPVRQVVMVFPHFTVEDIESQKCDSGSHLARKGTRHKLFFKKTHNPIIPSPPFSLVTSKFFHHRIGERVLTWVVRDLDSDSDWVIAGCTMLSKHQNLWMSFSTARRLQYLIF